VKPTEGSCEEAARIGLSRCAGAGAVKKGVEGGTARKKGRKRG